MKKSKKKTSKKTLMGIYRRPNMDPKIKYYESLAEIHTRLGSVPLSLAEIDGNMYVISRADAKQNGEPRNMYHTVTTDEISYTRDFHGDVVIIGYNPDTEKVMSLTKNQINRIMTAPRN